MTEIEIGKEYRLLPNSTNDGGRRSTLADTGTTRVQVVSGPDRDGDYSVAALNGDTRTTNGHLFSQNWFIHGAYLAPLDEPAAEPTPEPGSARYPAEIIASVLDRAFVKGHAVWLRAAADLAPDGTWGVVVTLDPDVGYDTEYRLTLKEV